MLFARRVVSRDLDVSNAEALPEPAKCGEERCAVVGHDLFDCALSPLSAQDFFE
jgi:hypothetical protein